MSIHLKLSANDDHQSSNCLLLLAARLQQMGTHSGYHLLAEALPAHWPGQTDTIYRRYQTPFPRLTHKVLHPFLRRMPVAHYYNYHSFLLEMAASRRMRSGHIALAHIMFTDNDYGFLRKQWRRGKSCLVGSVHAPSNWWRTHHPDLSVLGELDGIVVMSREQMPLMQEYCRGPIEFHRLGVDVDFFRPATASVPDNPPRFICCGVHLRDFKTLAEVVSLAGARIPEIQFDIVVPEPIRSDENLLRLASKEYVHWHSGLSDEDLRNLYQRSLALVLPLRDCAANNAVVEATACGLPILSTNLPGLRDYTTSDFADLFPPGAAEDYVRSMVNLVENRAAGLARGSAARQYAAENLTWPRLAVQMANFYKKSHCRATVSRPD